MREAKANTIDEEVLQRWMNEAMRVYKAIDDQVIANMNECRKIRARLPAIYKSAKNAGLTLKPFKLRVKQALFEKKIDDLNDKIDNLMPEDEEDAAIFEQMRSIALKGDLFDHAVRKHDAKEGDDDRDLRGGAQREADARRAREAAEGGASDEAHVADNVRKLRRGIRGLPGAEANEA